MGTFSQQAWSGMQRVSLDTHILVHSIQDDLRPFELRVLADATWCISPIVHWELAKLVQLGRVEIDLKAPAFVGLLSKLKELPITPTVARVSTELDFRSDPADELIAATSIVYGVPLLTRDSRIRASKMVPLADVETDEK